MNETVTPGANRAKVAAILRTIPILAYICVVFIWAGPARWPEFWSYLGFYLVTVTVFYLWLKKRDPGLLKERMHVRKDVKRWDRRIIRAYSVLLVILFLIAPLDAVRFHWSRVPPAAKWAAAAGLLSAWGVVFWAFRENAFLSGYVRIQSDRGHAVCTTGPYRFIRHPMYLAMILTVTCLPLFLGSLYSLIPAALISALFVLRTSLEDRTLREELPGYADYAARVRWRLVPKLW